MTCKVKHLDEMGQFPSSRGETDRLLLDLYVHSCCAQRQYSPHQWRLPMIQFIKLLFSRTIYESFFLSFGAPVRQWARASCFTRFRDHTQRRTTVGRTPLDEWSALRRDLCLTTHNTTDRHDPGGIRTHNLSRRTVADLRLRPRGHWDRHYL